MNIINQRKIRDEDIPALKRALEDQLANVTKELGSGTIAKLRRTHSLALERFSPSCYGSSMRVLPSPLE